MSDKEDGESPPEKPFYVDRAKTGRAGCKKCKQKIGQGELRLGKLAYNPFGSGTMKQWHHVPCIFEVFKKQRATTKKIESPDEIGGWESLDDADKEEIMSYFSPELKNVFKSKSEKVNIEGHQNKNKKHIGETKKDHQNHKDNSFKMFRKLCLDVSNNSSYLMKTKIISDFFEKGSDGESFKSDVELWCRLLLPGAVKRVYNLQSKQLVKLFSKIFETNHEEMLEDLEKGDVAETISTFFKKSKTVKEAEKSTLRLQEVDVFLEELTSMTKEEEQAHHFKKITKKCTANDLKMLLRLVKHDLRINAGAKHVLEALHKDAYQAYQTSRDIKSVVLNALKSREKEKGKKKESNSSKKGMEIDLNMMTPVAPMLAQPCKSVQMALEKCPNGMFSEIKYDGERVQLHKKGDSFKYFSRSLKPVLDHKVKHFKEYIPQAFPHGKDLILDAEILMVDNNTGKPLPFGTLGIHKKSEFKNATVCLFVFDCMHYNGKSLLDVSLVERKEILRKNMVEVKNHIMFSEMEVIHKGEDLEKMMTKVFKQGLEGLVLKDRNSTYEPGKRHWLKVKKDYLADGAMADSADLVVLGAWFGTGSKGGIMSSFLMGCFNPRTKKWLTVTKVSGGHDDETLDRIQRELDVVKISKDPSKIPSWLNCTRTMVPDFVAVDPKKMPVWEITGAEFTCNQVHTADGISIRFPRVTKIRSDKDWSTATNLEELKNLYEKSKDTSDFSFGNKTSSCTIGDKEEDGQEDEQTEKVNKKRKKEQFESGEKKVKKAKVEDDAYLEETDTEEDDRPEQNFELEKGKLPNSLPDIFTGCVIQMPKGYRNNHLLRRYLIAYDAQLYDPDRKTSLENPDTKVTHVVHLTKDANIKKEKFWSRYVRHVHVNWVWDSIKLLVKQEESKYVVTADQSS
ncbi:hypothetical protein RUM44_003055 [Polyplax serrata]|uniref:DNA ligase n=1 Tax=Polyplax serrata TaxID=468196 RepID=A0ABR1AXF9_POLSC